MPLSYKYSMQYVLRFVNHKCGVYQSFPPLHKGSRLRYLVTIEQKLRGYEQDNRFRECYTENATVAAKVLDIFVAARRGHFNRKVRRNMKRYTGWLFGALSLLVLTVAVLLMNRATPLYGVETVQPKAAVVGEYTVQVGDYSALLGDINNNGKIDTSDARMILQATVGKYGSEVNKGVEDLTEEEFCTADVDQNDTVNTTDARLVLQAAVGKITEFPEPDPDTTTTTGNTTTTAPTRKEATLSSEPVEDLTKATNAVVNESPDTFCNPINIAYGYRSDADEGYREGADPVVQVFNGEYYLFVSHNYGYWWSKDLTNWEFVACMDAEMDKWAPATCVVGDTMYLTHSQGGAIFKSTDPKSGKWTRVGQPVVWDDPALWYDEDGYVYCYYGCSNVNPLYVAKLDPNNNMALVGAPIECFYANIPAHGFEAPGDQNQNTSGDCWLEGAWMVKHEGKYYLNYAGPGTEYASYADGCYVADSPMGPFTFCTSSPVSYKATGFTVGAGHGATFQDLWGNWWKVDTIAVSQHSSWERRIELIPLTYDENGNQITNTVFLDYPTYVPALIEDNFGDGAQPDWNLLSYDVDVSVSSTLDTAYSADKAVDESIRTWWSAATGNADEWLTLDLGKLCAVNAVQVNFADEDAQRVSGRNNTYCYNYLIEFSQDGETWYTLADHTGVTAEAYKAQDTSHDYYELVSAIGARYIRLTNKGEIPAGGKFAVSGLRVFGNGQGEAPAAVDSFRVNRPVGDERTVTVRWDAADGAEGYIIRFGYDEDVLNQAYQVIGGTSATIRMLNMGVDYWFTIDTYNDSGYTKGTAVQHAPATREAPADTPVNQPAAPVETVVEGYTVYEMESGKTVNCDISTDAKASGKSSVHNLHNKNSYVELTGVDGGNGGEAKLHLAYSNGNGSASMQILVNGKSQGTVKLATSGNWNTFVAMEFDIADLTPGETNTIRIVGGIDEGFNPDFIQVIYDKETE